MILFLLLQLFAHGYTADQWNLFFARHMKDSSSVISELNDAESIIDVCLKLLMMETAFLGSDSSKFLRASIRFGC